MIIDTINYMNIFCKTCQIDHVKLFSDYYQSLLSEGYIKCSECKHCFECDKLECTCTRCYDCLELLNNCNCQKINCNFEPAYEDTLNNIADHILYKLKSNKEMICLKK